MDDKALHVHKVYVVRNEAGGFESAHMAREDAERYALTLRGGLGVMAKVTAEPAARVLSADAMQRYFGVGWREVTDEQPPVNAQVLAAEPGCGMAVCHRNSDGKFFDCYGGTISPTHWQELPPWPSKDGAS